VHLAAAYHSNGEELQLGVWDCPRVLAVNLSHFTLTHVKDSLTRSTSSSSSSSSSSHPVNKNSIQQDFGFAVFQNLTSLTLQYCCMNSLVSLAAVTGLSHLQLEKPQPPGFSPAAAAAYVLDAAPLARLQYLSSLQIIKGGYRGLLMAACQLTNLQDLQLIRCKDTGIAGFDAGQLWQQLLGLTSLQIETVPGLLLLSTTTSSSRGTVQPLQQLQRLEVVTAAGFDSLLLSSAKQLQHLHLTSTPLLGNSAGTATLLTVLSQITGLTYLNLRGTLQHVAAGVPYVVPAADYSVVAAAVAAAAAGGGGDGAGAGGTAAVYAALSASRWLQYLDLSRCVLPPDAVPALFGISSSSSSSNPRLPCLQQLLLADTFHAAADMRALVSACPALRRLDIIRATPYDSPLPANTLSALPQLQHLTNVSLCNVDDAAAEQLAKLTHLESLSVVWQSSVSDKGAQALTALRRLTQLWVHGALSSKLAPGYLLSLQSQVGDRDLQCSQTWGCQAGAAPCVVCSRPPATEVHAGAVHKEGRPYVSCNSKHAVACLMQSASCSSRCAWQGCLLSLQMRNRQHLSPSRWLQEQCSNTAPC
jgi:hypothetical protein